MFSFFRRVFARLHPRWFICAGKIIWTDGGQTITFLRRVPKLASPNLRDVLSLFMRASKPLKAADTRRIRVALGISQFEFAQYLGSKLGTVRSWEQGVRRPRSAALRLLTIAKDRPAVLLQRASR